MGGMGKWGGVFSHMAIFGGIAPPIPSIILPVRLLIKLAVAMFVIWKHKTGHDTPNLQPRSLTAPTNRAADKRCVRSLCNDYKARANKPVYLFKSTQATERQNIINPLAAARPALTWTATRQILQLPLPISGF